MGRETFESETKANEHSYVNAELIKIYQLTRVKNHSRSAEDREIPYFISNTLRDAIIHMVHEHRNRRGTVESAEKKETLDRITNKDGNGFSTELQCMLNAIFTPNLPPRFWGLLFEQWKSYCQSATMTDRTYLHHVRMTVTDRPVIVASRVPPPEAISNEVSAVGENVQSIIGEESSR